MKSKEEEYKEIFLAEALDNFEEINRQLIALEKSKSDKATIHALFRITHTLKGNAAGMGFSSIAEMAHVLEDLFGEMRDGKIRLDDNIFTSLYKGVDTLGALIKAIRDGSDVKYKGIKTKLEVLIKRAGEEYVAQKENGSELSNSPFAPEESMALVGSSDDESNSLGEADAKVSFSDLVQVPVRKLDNLLNLVGELIIEKDRILASQIGHGLYASNEYARLSRISSDLQYSVMDVRLVQVGFLFNKFHRVVRDAAALEKKNVALKLEGTDTEIDRNVLQVISDSLIHLIRNCIGHGIESSDERSRLGKSKEGTVWLTAKNDTDAVIIEIKDDGRGLNYEKIKAKAIAKNLITEEQSARMTEDELSMLIFEAGFSTMDQVTAISGRGVGMDVVRKTLDSIGGEILVASKAGEGTSIKLTLPSSMAVKSSLLFELGQEVYAIPLAYTESVISLYKTDIHKAGGGLVASHLGKNIAVVFLKDVFDHQFDRNLLHSNILQSQFDQTHDEAKLEIVVVSFNNRTVGFVVDKLLQQKEIVEKPLMRPVDKIKFIGGVTILGSGNVCLVLNIPFLLHFIFSLTSSKEAKSVSLN
jgi:two-component system chemotaxis sensor kinase CheA